MGLLGLHVFVPRGLEVELAISSSMARCLLMASLET